MLPHPVNITTGEITLGIVCLLLFACWAYDYICLLSTEVKLSEAEEENKKLAAICKQRILERNETQREYSEAIKHGLKLTMQLEHTQIAHDKALKQKHAATKLLLEACKSAREIDKLRVSLANDDEMWALAQHATVRPQHSQIDPQQAPADGPTPGTTVPDPRIPAVPAYAQASDRNWQLGCLHDIQSVQSPATSLKTDRTE